MSKYHDDRTAASDPGGVSLSPARFRALQPETRGLRGFFWRALKGGAKFEALLDEHLRLGDSRAAIVVRTAPLLVAAYTDELDCVVLLRFPDELCGEYQLDSGMRLLTVNTYARGQRAAADLTPGDGQLHRYVNFFPVIAELVSDDRARIEARKADIGELEWKRCVDLGAAALARSPLRYRDGSPLKSSVPGCEGGHLR